MITCKALMCLCITTAAEVASDAQAEANLLGNALMPAVLNRQCLCSAHLQVVQETLQIGGGRPRAGRIAPRAALRLAATWRHGARPRRARVPRHGHAGAARAPWAQHVGPHAWHRPGSPCPVPCAWAQQAGRRRRAGRYGVHSGTQWSARKNIMLFCHPSHAWPPGLPLHRLRTRVPAYVLPRWENVLLRQWLTVQPCSFVHVSGNRRLAPVREGIHRRHAAGGWYALLSGPPLCDRTQLLRRRRQLGRRTHPRR